MASQLVGITGNRRLKRNQTAALNARLPMLSNIVHAEQAEKMRKKDEEFKKKSLAQSKTQHKENLAFQREQQSAQQGLSMAKFGGTVLASDFNLNKFIPFGKGSGGGASSSRVAPGVSRPQYSGKNFTPSESRFLQKAPTAAKGGGLFSNINVGGAAKGALGGGLVGAGIGGMFGKDKKTKMIGGALGALGGGLYGSGALNSVMGGISDFFSGAFK